MARWIIVQIAILIIHHLAVFISRLWQIHVFGEGNTGMTAVLHEMAEKGFIEPVTGVGKGKYRYP